MVKDMMLFSNRQFLVTKCLLPLRSWVFFEKLLLLLLLKKGIKPTVVNNEPVEIHSHPSVIGVMWLSWSWRVCLMFPPSLAFLNEY